MKRLTLKDFEKKSTDDKKNGKLKQLMGQTLGACHDGHKTGVNSGRGEYIILLIL